MTLALGMSPCDLMFQVVDLSESQQLHSEI